VKNPEKPPAKISQAITDRRSVGLAFENPYFLGTPRGWAPSIQVSRVALQSLASQSDEPEVRKENQVGISFMQG